MSLSLSLAQEAFRPISARPRAGILALLALMGWIGTSIAPMQVEGQELGRQLGHVSVLVTGVEGAEGVVRCALFNSPQGFPLGSDEATAFQRVFTEPGWGEAGCIFRDLPPGEYAIAVYHDRNENGILDTNLLGVPTEGVGASQNVIPRMGPPKFDENAFEVGLGASVWLTVRLRYYSAEECQRAAQSRPCRR